MKFLVLWVVLNLQTVLLSGKGICPGELLPCSGSCTEKLINSLSHSDGERVCSQRKKRLFMGSRRGGDMEASCKEALPSDRFVWSRYKIRSGLTVDESGVHIEGLDWDLEYCVTMRNTQQFAPRSCSWTAFRAICVTPDAPISQSDASRCEREWYHVSSQNYNFKDAYNYCRRNDMNLAVPSTVNRVNCLKSVLKTKSEDAWIDYKIRDATFPIDPWDENYCVKIDLQNRYTIDRCQMQLTIVCGSFGDLEVTGGVVRKGREGSISCRCFDCTTSQIEWTDGISTWHSNTKYTDKFIVTLCQGGKCKSTLTINNAPADQVYTCVQRLVGGSIIYAPIKLDVYDLTPSAHYITAGALITMTCSFYNEQYDNVQRVDWIDQRDNNNITRLKKEEWHGKLVTSYVEVLREDYTHNVSCNFVTDMGQFSAMVQIVIFEIRARDVEVPADTKATLRCTLEIGQGDAQIPVFPTSTYWEQGKKTYTSEADRPYLALLEKEMRLGKDLWSCHFRFRNGDRISKNIWVNAFQLAGISGDVARNKTGYMSCTYSRGGMPSQPLFWEREGVRLLNNNKYEGETYKISSNSRNDSYYQAFTSIEVHNASRSANYSCCVSVEGGIIYRRLLHLNVFPGNFLANNVTILEALHPNTGEIVVTCAAVGFPPPFLTLVAENKLVEGNIIRKGLNVTHFITNYPRTCEDVTFKCTATNEIATWTMVAKSHLGKNCGIFAKVSGKVWGIIAGVLLLLILLIVFLCCYFCRRTKKLKEEVVSQREILSTVGSVHYGQNIANSRMMLPSHDIPYSDDGYDDLNRKGIIEDDNLVCAQDYLKKEPLLSPRFDRDPIFMKRSQSRGEIHQMFSPQLEKKMTRPTLSYQNLRNAQHTPSYQSQQSFQKTKRSNSAHSLTKGHDDHYQMNPYGKFQRLKNEESDYDEEMSLFSRAPSSASKMQPSVGGMPPSVGGMPPSVGGILSPREWDKKSMASSATPSGGGPPSGLFSPNPKSPSLKDLKEQDDPFNYDQWKGNKNTVRDFTPIDTDEELSPNLSRHNRKLTLPRKSMDVENELNALNEANLSRMFSPMDNRQTDGIMSSPVSAFKKPIPLRHMSTSPISSSQSERTPTSSQALYNSLYKPRNTSRSQNNTPTTARDSHPSTDATLEISASPYNSNSLARNDLNNGPHTSCSVSCSAQCPKSPTFVRQPIPDSYQSESEPQSDYVPPPNDWMGSKSTCFSEVSKFSEGSDPLDWKGSAATELTLDDLSQVDELPDSPMSQRRRDNFLDQAINAPMNVTSSRAGTPMSRGSIDETSSRAGTPMSRGSIDETSSVTSGSVGGASSRMGNQRDNGIGGVKVLPSIPMGRSMLKKTNSKFIS